MDLNNDQENNNVTVKTEKTNPNYNDNNHINEPYDDYFEEDSFDENCSGTDAQELQTNDNNMGDTNNKLPEPNEIKPNNPEVGTDNIAPVATNSNAATPADEELEVNDDEEDDDNQQEDDLVDNSEDKNNLNNDEPMEDVNDEFEQNANGAQSSTWEQNNAQPDIWVLPADKNVCTLEEIRRGQRINKKPPTMCPVMGCGKIINEAKAEPSPGTIASGLRTHVLFVHYATQHGRKVVKKRKTLGWSTKKRNQSPRKQLNQLLASRFSSLEQQSSSMGLSSTDDFRNDPLDLKQQSTSDLLANLQKNMAAALTPASQAQAPGSLLDKKVKQMAANKSLQVLQMSSHQSLMQASGPNISSKLNSNQVQRQKNLNTPISTSSTKQNNNTNSNTSGNNSNNNNFNSTTSSLFSILAGLTAQQQKNPQQPSLPRNIKTAHGTNTINISQCTRNPNTNSVTSNNNRTANSSLLSLLNEKISGNVASSLQNQLKKSIAEQRLKGNTSTPRISTSPALTSNSSYYHPSNNETNANGASLLSNLCSSGVGLSDDNGTYDTSMPLNTFVDMIAMRTGSNIGQTGIAEVKKFIEKFTTSLICNSQTIADHYVAPYGGETGQQKPEISPSDVILAYKMMNKSQGQL